MVIRYILLHEEEENGFEAGCLGDFVGAFLPRENEHVRVRDVLYKVTKPVEHQAVAEKGPISDLLPTPIVTVRYVTEDMKYMDPRNPEFSNRRATLSSPSP